MADQTIDALAREVMARELQQRPGQFETQPTGPAYRPGTKLDPELLALLGGLADAGSTYAFLKRGTGSEANAMFSGMSPLATATGVAGGALGMKGVRALIRKAGKSGIADTLASVQGANQIGLAALNTRPQMSPSSDQAYISKTHEAFRK